MPRTGRIYQRAMCYHVMNRGVNRRPLFADDEDREYFKKTVVEYKELCGARVYHWVWMSNHYHMLVDRLTDENPYMGAFDDPDRIAYGDALMSGEDEKVVRQVEGCRAIGTKEFAATLKMERGRYRVKRGRPVVSV